jgi:hypothetical protein
MKPRHAMILSACLAVYMAIDGIWMAFFSDSRWSAPLAAAAFLIAVLNCGLAIAYKMLGGPLE